MPQRASEQPQRRREHPPENRLMNRRVSVRRRVGTALVCPARAGLIALSGLWLAGGIAVAQPATPGSPTIAPPVGGPTGPSAPAAAGAGPTLPTNIKNAPGAEPFRPQIQQFIQGQLQALTGEDAVAQKAARDKLITECTAGSTQSFFDVYAAVLSEEIDKLLKQPAGKSLRTRLSIAVIVNKVATVGKTIKLEPAVILLINDPLEPVAIKGMQAAKPVLAVVYQNPGQIAGDKLVLAIKPAVTKHAKPAFPNDEAPGFLIADAYDALIPEVTPTLNANQVTAAVPYVLDAILDLLDFRIQLFTAAIPPQPSAESRLPALFSRNFAAANAKQQLRIVQSLVNLIEVAGQQAQNAAKGDLLELIPLLKNAAGTLIVVSPSQAAVQPVLQPILQLTTNTPGPQVAQKTKGVFAAMQLQFKDLKPPPPVTVAAPTTAASATAPVTAPH
jgi:hypothetical protein